MLIIWFLGDLLIRDVLLIYYISSTVNGSALITLHINNYPSITTILSSLCPQFNSFLPFFAQIISPGVLGSCVKIALKHTRLVNAYFPCLQIYQSAYNILFTSALFIFAEYSLVVFQVYFSTYMQSGP